MGTYAKSVYSSNVQTIGYDTETRELRVEWNTGRVSIYSGVPEGVAISVMNSYSVGSALNANIKGVYAHRYAR